MSIEVRDMGFWYTSGKPIFQNLNLDIQKGRVLSILGPNGAGKSTLLGCIARFLLPQEGKVVIDGVDYLGMSQPDVAQAIGFVPQSIAASFDYMVIDYVVTGCAPRMKPFQKPKEKEYEIAWDAIRSMGIEHIAEKSIMRISSGERQQAAIARAIGQRPKFILLDEPTAHLDIGNQVKVLGLLQELADRGYGVAMTTHNPDHVLILGGDVAAIDRQGRLTFGSGQDILDEEFLERLYGTQLKVFPVPGLDRVACVARGIG